MKQADNKSALRSSPYWGWLLLLAASLLLYGCGGSSSSSRSTSSSGPYQVSVSISGPGTTAPLSASLAPGEQISFLLLPADGYLVDQISGCNGSRSGDQYLVGPISANCQISLSFRGPRLAGRIFAAEGTAADSDVNNPNAPFVSNNTEQQAQLLPNPVTVGGYVNRPGAGPLGRSRNSGDTHDFFRVDLEAGQQVILQIAATDSVANDLDLILLDAEGDLVDASLGTTHYEMVTAPADGTYYLLVHAFSGASNYLLSVGQQVAGLPHGPRLSDAFAPGEALVVDATAPLLPAASGQARMHSMLLRNPPRLHRFSSLEQVQLQTRLQTRADALLIQRQRLSQQQQEKLDTLLHIKLLQQQPQLALAEPNYSYQMQFTPADPYYGFQWHYPLIQLPDAWDQATGTGVRVAVIDSGVALGHPDLQGQLLPGYDFLLQQPGGDDPGENPRPPGGSSFHGTHVAGTIAAASNNNLGVAGVAFDSQIMPLRVCDNTCSGQAVYQALLFAAGLSNSSGSTPAQPAHIINLSLGRSGAPSNVEQALYTQLRDMGILVVAAAGNQNTTSPSYPAAYDGVLAVGAVDILRQRAYYANFGPWLDLTAPGGDARFDRNNDGYADGVLSTHVDDRSGSLRYNYRFLQGTSMAAPHVAGVLALMRQHADIDYTLIQNWLQQGELTDDLGTPGFDQQFGHGLINAQKAVQQAIAYAGTAPGDDPLLVATPRLLNFGAGQSSMQVQLSNAGGGDLVVAPPTENSGGWLNLVQDDMDPLRWEVQVDRSGLASGSYQAQVLFGSNANLVQVLVYMQVGTGVMPNTGHLYVLLLDPEALTTVTFAAAMPDGAGGYQYDLGPVPPGTYLLVTGSDNNNNGFICDAGEACGAYPSMARWEEFTIHGADRTDLDFTANYDEQFGAESLQQFAPLEIPAATTDQPGICIDC